VTTWSLRADDLKHYPHFDKNLPREEGELIAKTARRVQTNAFYPFLRYVKTWQPFRQNGKDKKERPIRYASRRDAYIFTCYRHILSEKYEIALKTLGIEDCPIAYRKIPLSPNIRQGKCNIHFARDAFDAVVTLGDCTAVSLDISSYFESLDHARLHSVWCRMIEMVDLPPDHAAVFKAITKYSFVDREKAYERLGYFGLKTKNGRSTKGFLKSFKEMPKQLCTPEEFRQKIAGGDPELPSLIEQNKLPYGIPQGAPISDILANMYLIDFDALMSTWARSRGGVYCRYSDDILIIIPGAAPGGIAARDYAHTQIINFGDKIQIKPSKSSIVCFTRASGADLHFESAEGSQCKNGLEYLGFRLDGRQTYLRDSTLSGFYRKITYSLRHEARALVARYPGKDLRFLQSAFDLNDFAQRFGRVEGFDSNTDYRDWTFWTYARRSAEIFGTRGTHILRQLRNHQKLIRDRANMELEDALKV
jgi:Reverse transcriptase (RNA-dependent DNA polymerase)